jgi:hypothetical protein
VTVIPGNTDYVRAQHWSFPEQSLVYQQHPSGTILSVMDHEQNKEKIKREISNN